MGRAIIGGVVTSTLLTLVVVPVFYSYMEGLAARLRRGPRPHPAVEPMAEEGRALLPADLLGAPAE